MWFCLGNQTRSLREGNIEVDAWRKQERAIWMRIHLFSKHLFSVCLLNTLYMMPNTVLWVKNTIFVERQEPDKTPYSCTAYFLIGSLFQGKMFQLREQEMQRPWDGTIIALFWEERRGQYNWNEVSKRVSDRWNQRGSQSLDHVEPLDFTVRRAESHRRASSRRIDMIWLNYWKDNYFGCSM